MGGVFCRGRNRETLKKKCKHEDLQKFVVSIKLEGCDQINEKQFEMLNGDKYDDLIDEISTIFFIIQSETPKIKLYFVGQDILKKQEWEEVEYKKKINFSTKLLCVIDWDKEKFKDQETKIIGISGPCGAAKTQILEILQYNFGGYFMDQNNFINTEKTISEEFNSNFDDPQVFDWQFLVNSVLEKKQNSKMPFIFVKGFNLFYEEEVRNIFDYMIHIDLDEQEMYKRRMEKKRIAQWKYREFVIPEFRKYTTFIKETKENIKKIDGNLFIRDVLEQVTTALDFKKIE